MQRPPLAVRALALLAPILAFASCSSEPSKPLPDVDRKLVVASDLDHEPFLGRDATGKPTGRDVEMMEQIGRTLGLPIEWHVVPFQEVMPLVAVGAVDVGCATLGITPDRKERVDFTRPYFHTTIAVVVRAEEGSRSFSELAGKRVGCPAGTTAERAVRRLLRDALCVPSTLDDAALRESLLHGQIDAIAVDAPDAERMVEAAEGKLVRMRRDLDAELYGLALPKTRADLRRRIDKVLESMEESGELARLDEAYGLR